MDRINSILNGLAAELSRAEQQVAHAAEADIADAKRHVAEVEAEIRRVEAELGITKPAKAARRTPDAKAERAVATPAVERA